MIGVDVIDLTDPLLRKRDARAFRLIKHPLEPLPEKEIGRLFWAYWTAKEAAYKCLRTSHTFAPNRIFIHFNRGFSFTAAVDAFSDRKLVGSVTFSPHYVLAVARDESVETFDCSFITLSSQRQSDQIRQELISHFELHHTEPAVVQTGQDGLPRLITPNSRRIYCCSFSHHGSCGAFAYAPAGNILEKNF